MIGPKPWMSFWRIWSKQPANNLVPSQFEKISAPCILFLTFYHFEWKFRWCFQLRLICQRLSSPIAWKVILSVQPPYWEAGTCKSAFRVRVSHKPDGGCQTENASTVGATHTKRRSVRTPPVPVPGKRRLWWERSILCSQNSSFVKQIRKRKKLNFVNFRFGRKNEL